MTAPEFDMDALKAWADQINEVATKLMAEQPHLNPVTAHIIAQDILSASAATTLVNEGMDPTKAYVRVGSFARWDWVVTMVKAGKISETWFVANIADLWSGADPDDTNPEYLNLWKNARHRNGGLIRDGRPLPKPKALDKGKLRVYRGGNPFTIRHGFAWTTDPKIAGKFSRGAGERVPVKGGVVIVGEVKPSDVLAYITRRGESEVIVDPRFVANIHPTGDR